MFDFLKNKKILFSALVVYFAATGITYFLFSKTPLAQKISSPVGTPTVDNEGNLVFDESLPKTEPCPISGQKYSKQQRDWWETHRPLGVMIENHQNARPQSGLNAADTVYEVVAEGGITRFLAIYYCSAPVQIGPVRSARTYFLDYISEYGDSPLYAHVGGANTPGPADALSQINKYGWGSYNDLNQFSIGFPTFWRDYNRLGHTTATEHTMYSTTDKLWKFAEEERGLGPRSEDQTPWDEGFSQYSFKDKESKGSVQTVHIEHWSSYGDYFIDWVYDPATNSYNRKNGGKAHMDRNTNKQINTKNVVVIFTRESSANDGYENNVHLLYKTVGEGDAKVFIDGEEIDATWSKDSREGKTILKDSNGEEIEFNRGKIWFHIVPLDGVASVK
ncbi:MAG: hypothetical protein A3A51_01360 [Candidatus Levybacteria bacterium RIFCSPLOWO2_01_FULL_39_10]|nr:MAG: hypothetical protein A3A51_01360 [Candidatus Levybacteria bacterium RIFCSPLOWO2_01_FULL_39_10]